MDYFIVRVAGIESASQPWEGRVLPLNHTRLRSAEAALRRGKARQKRREGDIQILH